MEDNKISEEDLEEITSDEKTGIGAFVGVGVLTGVVGATVATIWGGYELGSVINDALGVTSYVGRGALDLLVMSVVAGPAYCAGIFGGMIAGTGVGVVYKVLTDKEEEKKEE